VLLELIIETVSTELCHKNFIQCFSTSNAGLPNAFGEYDETPAEMQSQIKPI
jgi:methionine synthase I (cobalamin-dependent)